LEGDRVGRRQGVESEDASYEKKLRRERREGERRRGT